MNIFILSSDPVKAAQFQCDKHVVKMVLESAQMLSTAHRVLDGTEGIRLSEAGRRLKSWKLDNQILDELLYKATHINHPCNKWVRESSENYYWLYRHFIALAEEYTYRYNKTHLSQTKLANPLLVAPHNIPRKLQTKFVCATDSLNIDNDPIATYRTYYRNKQENFNMVWTKRQKPDWF